MTAALLIAAGVFLAVWQTAAAHTPAPQPYAGTPSSSAPETTTSRTTSTTASRTTTSTAAYPEKSTTSTTSTTVTTTTAAPTETTSASQTTTQTATTAVRTTTTAPTEPTETGPSETEPTDPEPTKTESTDPEPSQSEPTDPEPSETEPTDRDTTSTASAAEPVQPDGPLYVPILLYHHLSDEMAPSSTVISTASFERQMSILFENGYESITFEQLYSYVVSGTPLPEKPVVITFDDGYMSNYQYAFPVLKQYGFKATVFVIGSSIGRSEYKNTGIPIIPHFGAAEIEQMVASGLITIHSHTFDMHQTEQYENGLARMVALPIKGESDEEFAAAFVEDILTQDAVFRALGLENSRVFAFPKGQHNEIADRVLKNSNFIASVTTDRKKLNKITPGDPGCLMDMGRLTCSDALSDAAFLDYLQQK